MIAGLAMQVAAAQVKDGRVVYERKVNMHKRLGPDMESMKNMIPQFDVSKVELLFSGNESIYRRIQEEEDIRESAGDGGDRQVVRMRFNADNELYKNYNTQKALELTELGPKKYLIDDSIRQYNWKLDETGDTKQIKGYTCKKATTKNTRGENMTVWYTEQIACPSGPEAWGGLPGLIMEIDVADGQITFIAVEVTEKVDKKMVGAPTGGKKITRKEHQKMLEEQFGVNPHGGPTQFRIIRQ